MLSINQQNYKMLSVINDKKRTTNTMCVPMKYLWLLFKYPWMRVLLTEPFGLIFITSCIRMSFNGVIQD